MRVVDMSKNLRKLCVIVLGSPIYLLSFFVPRNPKKIVVGGHTGFSDNGKYFFLLAPKYLPDYEIHWISNRKREITDLRESGYKAHYYLSISGLKLALTAGWYLYSFHLIDINFWASGRAKKINMWHGLPLKDIAFKIKEGPSSKIYNTSNIFSWFIRPHIFIRPDFMVTTSEKMTTYFAEAFRIEKSQCLEIGLPRCDVFDMDTDRLVDHIRLHEPPEMTSLFEKIQNHNKCFIYMPTWRETPDFLDSASFDLDALARRMKEKNSLFIFKLHPFTKISKDRLLDLEKYENLILFPSNLDVYPILPFTTCLISDYSSIYYDYLLLGGKKIVLYPFDLQTYQVESRALAFDYDKAMPAKRTENFDELLTEMFEPTSDAIDISNVYEEYQEFSKGNATRQLCAHIEATNQTLTAESA